MSYEEEEHDEPSFLETLKQQQQVEDWMQEGIQNSYEMLVEGKTLPELLANFSETVTFLPPDEEPCPEDLDTMISHFEDLEEYEKCAKLLKIKNSL